MGRVGVTAEVAPWLTSGGEGTERKRAAPTATGVAFDVCHVVMRLFFFALGFHLTGASTTGMIA